MMSGLHDGRIKALYLIGENPAHTEPNAHHVEEGLAQLEFLVSQDIFLNDTARKHADVVFPASSFAEKDGTFTNTERRVNRVRAGGAAARAGARGLADRARPRAGAGRRLARVPDAPRTSGTSSPTSRRTGAGSATTGSRRSASSGRAPTATIPGSQYLLRAEPGAAERARASSIPVEYQPPIEEPDSEYPFVLSTGRTLYHYNSATMTMREDGRHSTSRRSRSSRSTRRTRSRSGSRRATGCGSSRGAASSRRARRSATASTPASSGWRSTSRRRR